MKLSILASLLVLIGGASPRALADWTDRCDATASGAIDLSFHGAPCRDAFLKVFESSSTEATLVWMRKNRGCFREWAHFAWTFSHLRSARAAELAWTHQLSLLGEKVLGLSRCTSASSCEGLLSRYFDELVIAPIDQADRDLLRTRLDQAELNTVYQARMDQAFKMAPAVCAYHFNFECIDAMKMALTWMYPRSYWSVFDGVKQHSTLSMLPVMRTVFSDDLTQEYAVALARKIIGLRKTGVFPSQTFYEIAYESFKGDLRRFFEFMAVYATRGSGVLGIHELFGPSNRPMFAALTVISAAMGFFDVEADAKGTTWSYFSELQSTCYQPKPYHFWMSGAFSWLLSHERVSDRTSLLVSRLLGAMYEVASDTYGRDPDAIFFVPFESPTVNRTRREIVHQYLGAKFGVDPKLTRRSVDALMDRCLKQGTPLPSMSAEEMKTDIADPQTRWEYWTRLTGYYSLK